jgi:hypothetical protein
VADPRILSHAERWFLLTVATFSLDCGVCVVIVASCEEEAGAAPQWAKRQRSVELRERGWCILAAAREVVPSGAGAARQDGSR